MIEVYGLVPQYTGRGRPPTRKKTGTDWLYLQMVKQRDESGHFSGTKLKAIFGSLEEVTQLLGKTTAYIERSNLTSRLFNGRQGRKRWRSLRRLIAIGLPQPGKICTTISSNLTRVCAYGFMMSQVANGNCERLLWPLG
jgi:hypothetical protein